jgi:histidyl-tRNA synthetase
MGLERLVAILEDIDTEGESEVADVYLVLQGEAAQTEGLVLAEALRDALPGAEVVCNCGGGGMKAQFKRADRSGARFAVVIGEQELADGTVVLKPLRTRDDQTTVARSELTDALKARL